MKTGRPPTAPAIRFWRKVDRSGGPAACWPFTGARSRQGYGVFDNKPAHRVAWELTNGPIEPGLLGLHKCDNPPCCNPAHLFKGTQADNMKDMRAKGRDPSGDRHYSKKHPEKICRGERHPAAILTWESVRAIRQRATAGEKRKALADEFKVKLCTIHDIMSNRSWQPLKETG